MEGPSLVIISEELESFIGKIILDASGNTKLDTIRFINKKIVDIFSWGKHIVFQFDTFAFRIHFLMFGSYRINTRREGMLPRLSLNTQNGEINFYNCSIKFIEEDNARRCYDWEIDIMSSKWNKEKVIQKVLECQNAQIGDVLLDQDIFAGVGNIIKNEVLFICKINPETIIKNLSEEQIEYIVDETHTYSHNFYKWKKIFELKKHWQIYRKRICPMCGSKIIIKKTGKLKRRSFICATCLILY